MAEKDKISGFIRQLYGDDKDRRFSKDDIVSRASSDIFPADIEIFFKELPGQSYDERRLVDDLNSIIMKRNRVQAVGGKIEE